MITVEQIEASPACAQCRSNARTNLVGGYPALAKRCLEYCELGHRGPAEVSDDDIRAFRAEARAVDDKERCRASNAALGLPTSDGALGILDAATCRKRVAELIVRERTPGTSFARKVPS